MVDLVPATANLLAHYDSFAALVQACDQWCETVNARVHKEIAARPAQRLLLERPRLHRLPEDPHTAALGESRLVGDDQTVRFGATRYSLPREFVREQVWCRVVGEELAIYARSGAGGGIREAWRHQLSTPGNPVILDEHYDGHPAGRSILEPPVRPRGEAETAFIALGPGAERWLREAAASGTARMHRKLAQAVDLSHVVGGERADRAYSSRCRDPCAGPASASRAHRRLHLHACAGFWSFCSCACAQVIAHSLSGRRA